MIILGIQRISWVVKLIAGSQGISACRSRLASIVAVSRFAILSDYSLMMVKGRC